MGRSFFDLAAFERRALILLFALMILLNWWRRSKIVPDHPWPQLKFAELIAKLDSMEAQETSKEPSRPIRPFNPNKDPLDSLVSKGVRPALARNIINYRKQVGPFRNELQLKQLYALKEGEWDVLSPYVRIHGRDQQTTPNAKEEPCQELQLNLVNAQQLMAGFDLNKALASRIISYRELLGGFASMEQLSEVYGMKDKLAMRLKACAALDSGELRTLQLNHAAFNDLLRHPYLDLEMVKQLTKARTKTSIRSDQDLLVLPGWDSATIRRMDPYIQWTH